MVSSKKRIFSPKSFSQDQKMDKKNVHFRFLRKTFGKQMCISIDIEKGHISILYNLILKEFIFVRCND
jgi:hypothetical protein